METDSTTTELRVRINLEDLLELPRGERIRILRSTAGLTQAELAEATRVSRTAVYEWEKGRASPSDESIWRVCRVLGVPAYVIATPPPSAEKEDEEEGDSTEEEVPAAV